ncbi:SIMPL domain-containing protein [Candidatus Woesearchaeota archaeon]|nr:SIMPL domain-containing protein [Candidatus Woesearchaeota archaeon]
MNNNIVISVLAMGLVIVALVLAVNNSASPQQDKLIQVSGEASLTTMPDEAVVLLGVEHTSDTAEQAQAMVAQDINNVMAALKNQGIPENKIETSSFQVYPRQEWNQREQKYEQKGFTASHMLKVTSTEVNSVGRLLDAAVSAGANNIQSVSFQLTRESQAGIRKELLKLAGEDARAKADAMAEGLGVMVGSVSSAQESGPIFLPVMFGAKALAEAAPSQISPQSLEVSASLQISYQIV